MSDAIEPFEIHVSDEVLEDLRRRLGATRLPDQMEGVGWDYGVERSHLESLLDTWRNDFDWRAHEERLNAWPHFRTGIDGQSIHFLHARSPHEDAHPLLISHGWPGTIVEFLDILGPLTDPTAHGGDAADAFHVIAPSLPGYGFSEPTKTRGWDCFRIAEAWKVLMERLGYVHYGAQGGDWGAIITTALGHCDPEHLSGIHLNMPFAFPPPEGEEGLSEAEKNDLAFHVHFDAEGAGYQKIQGTKPQTLAYGLNDSPAGLCAWIAEKFQAWTDCGGDPDRGVDRQDLLANITIYWATQTINSSTRLYYETFKSPKMAVLANKVDVPTGVARFPKEIMRFPRSWVENHYRLTHWSEFERGGHFAAMEQPEALVGDIRAFFRTVR